MSDANPTVLVIVFASIPDFLKSDPPDGPSSLVLDVRLPGKDHQRNGGESQWPGASPGPRLAERGGQSHGADWRPMGQRLRPPQ
jgi:hypothetical protein